MNDIQRTTTRATLSNFLLKPSSEDDDEAPTGDVMIGVILTHSRLDDELSVAVVTFSDTPRWLHRLNRDPCGFPKKTPFGTIWKDHDRFAIDERGQTEYMRAVAEGTDPLYVEMLAEFTDTEVNTQDLQGRTALHWACAGRHSDMVQLCLSVPECDIGLKDHDGLTAFDISLRSGDELGTEAFYQNMFDLDQTDPQAALLRALTVSSEPAQDGSEFPGEAIFDPIQDANVPLVAALIKRGVDLTATNSDGDTALHVAADDVQIAGMLIDAGSDVNAIGNGGATPLHRAVQNQQLGVAMLLVQRGADLAVKDTLGCTALNQAEEHMEDEILALLTSAAHTDGQAVQVMVTESEEEMMIASASVDAVDETDGPGTPVAQTQQLNELSSFAARALSRYWLLQAVEQGNLYDVERLLKKGTSTKIADWKSHNLLHIAAENGRTNIIEALLNSGIALDATDRLGRIPLHSAAENGHHETVKYLLAAGAQKNTMDNRKSSALHHAATKGYQKAVQVLLDGAADTELKNYCNNTALHCAAENGHQGVVRTLIERKARLDPRNQLGRTPLHLAAENGHRETVKTLVLNRANVNAREERLFTPLHMSAAKGHREVVEILLTHGAGIGVPNTKGETALHLAAGNGHKELVQSLLSEGADPSIVNHAGYIPLHTAAEMGETGTVEVFVGEGSQIDVKSSSGTALQLASKHGHKEVVKILKAAGAQNSFDRFRSAVRDRLTPTREEDRF